MDLIGLVDRITEATTYIDRGRKGFATKGKAEEGRISYENGVEIAMIAFQEAQISADPQTLFLAECTPGVDPIEKALLEQRRINLSTAQSCYVEKQKMAMFIGSK